MKKAVAIVLGISMSVALTGCNISGITGLISGTDEGKDDIVVTGINVKEDEDPKVEPDEKDPEDDKEDEPEIDDDNEEEYTAIQEEMDRETVDELRRFYGSVEEDELEWEFDGNTKTIIISGEGPMTNYTYDPPEWDLYLEEIEHVIIGDEVTSIGDGAFLDYPYLKDVYIGDKVEYIGDFAFEGSYITDINFPAELKYVGEDAFDNCTFLSDSGFILPEGLLYIGPSSFFSAFKESYVSIPSSLVFIEKDAFANCFVDEFRVDEKNPKYTSVAGVLYTKEMDKLVNYPAMKSAVRYEIPDTVEVICSNAIETTMGLDTIVIPESVKEIEEKAIFWNYDLKYIEVDENNQYFEVIDGVLYSKGNNHALICYPMSDRREIYTIDEGTEYIYPYAFSEALYLTEVHASDELERIGYAAFYNCDYLEKISLSADLETIEKRAFDECDSLTEVNYASTINDWKQVGIEDYNDPLKNAKLVCVK